MTQRQSLGDRMKFSFGTDNESNEQLAESKTPEVQFIGGVYRTAGATYADGDNVVANFTDDGKLLVEAELQVGDIEIGAVEIKDGASDNRQTVTSDGSARILKKELAESTVPTAVSDGDEVAAWYDVYGRLVQLATNMSTGALQTEQISSIEAATIEPAEETTLTAAGSTPAVDIGGYACYGYSVTVASIDTTAVVQLEGSDNGSDWGILSLANDCTVVPGISGITENQVTFDDDGTYKIFSRAPTKYVRFTFESETGGTAVTLVPQLFARNS